MKSILKYKLLSFILIMSMLLVYVPVSAAYIDEYIMNEDFESYSTSTNLKKEGFIVWSGASVGSDGDNNYLYMYGTDSGTNAQTAIELSAEPDADKVIVCLDFMMPEDPSVYDAWIFGVLNDSDRGKAAANIQLSNGTLYDGASADSSAAVRTGLLEDKWYKAFLVVDLENDTYTLYSGGFKSETKSFQSSKTYSKTNIFFNVRVKSLETPLYVDNVKIFPVKNEEFEVAFYQASGLLMESEMGYESGQYPKTAYNMFKSCYDEILTATEGTLSSSQASEYAEKLNEAIESFIASRIDESGQDGIARYILFETPDEIAVGEEGVSRQLVAKTYDNANQLVDSEIAWEIEEAPNGVSLTGNTLSAEGGVRGSVTLKATAGEIYDYCTVNLTEGRLVKSIKVEGTNGTVTATGSFVSKPLEDVTVSVNGDDIEVTDILSIASDASFAWSANVGNDKAFQFITVHLEGNDTAPYSITAPYYGVGWEDAVLEAFNGAQSEDDIEGLVKTYSAGTGIDIANYTANQSAYDSVIYGGIPYADLNSLKTTIENFECVLAFRQAISANIEAVVENHKALLAENGFDSVAYEGLSENQKVIFYASVMDITFGEETTVEDIATYLSDILGNINAPSDGMDVSGAVEQILKDDFEIYDLGTTIGGGGYIRWGGDTVQGDSNNKYLQMLREADSRARVAMEFSEEPDADEVIVSWDFMMPYAPDRYNADVMGILSDDGNRPSVYIHLEDGIIYDGKSTGTNPIKTGLKQGKWYNAFLHIDLADDTYTLYIDEFKSGVNNFQTAVQVQTDIFFNLENYEYNVPLYYDNFELSAIKHSNLAIALYRAESIMKNCEVGYSNGQYSQTAYNMLKNTYNAMFKASCNENMTAEQADVYADAVNEAIEKFKSNKIGSGSASTPSYILFDIPDAVGIDDTLGYTRELSAQVYNSSNNAINTSVMWSLAENYQGVSITENRLSVNAGVRGDIIVRATAGDVYDEHTIKLADCKTFEALDIDSRNGEISITGKLSAKPLEEINLSVAGYSLELNGTLAVAEDNNFSWSHNVDASLPYGTITVTLEGFDTPQVQKRVPFYGVGWEDAVLDEFNSASSKENAAQRINTYYIGTGIELAEYSKYSRDYNNRIYRGGKDYASFAELKNTIEDLQCLVAFYEATRTDIESVFSDHIGTLERNGFNKAVFENLTPDRKIGVFASSLAVTVDTAGGKVSDLAATLNKITEDAASSDIIKDPDDDAPGGSGGGSLGGGGSSGGGGGGGSSSKDDLYDIKLVTGQQQTPAEGTENNHSITTQFADAHLTPWANDALLFVREKGIMIGDGTNVRPTDVVTRGEFAKIISVAFELAEKKSGKAFDDSGNKWWKEYADIVSAYGIMNGIGESTFGGEEHITRQMMAVSVHRALSVKGKELYDQNTGVEFSDGDAIADYAKEAVSYLAQKGIVSGIGNGLFAPELPVKRAEVAQIIYNILTLE